jgi:cell division septation protein DedD
MMRNRMGDVEPDEAEQKDTELTLGPAMLIGLVCGLLLLCGACFGVGYSLGRHGARAESTMTQTADTQTPSAQPAGSLGKPMASGTIPVAPAATSQTPALTPADATPAGNALTSYAPAANAPAENLSPAAPSLVHPALPQPTTVQAATLAQPAAAPASGPMVQIAAVSHSEDADVLMGALRKHGYAVTARRMASDSLIHVQIGPFASRAEASAMSQKLLNDGYNAVVLP